MKTKIEVKDRKEGDQIRRGLADPSVRAFVKVIGILNGLPSQRAKARTLQFVADLFDEKRPEA